jgi:hypothetical protein
MPSILRAAFAVVVGFVAWIAIGSVGNLLLRGALPGYEAVEKAMDFSVAMLLARLVVGAACSIGAGWACGAVWRGGRGPGYALALLLLMVFAPVHLGLLLSKFPVWYHATFLITLAPLVMLGFGLARARASKAG